jgi:hypothetical protein
MKFYKENGLGTLSALMEFLHPPGESLRYYLAYCIGSPAIWFAGSTIALGIFGASALVKVIRKRNLDRPLVVVILCAVLQLAFAFFAYGNRSQHTIFQPLIAAGMLIGISLLPAGRFRKGALATFIGISFLAQSGEAYKTWMAWRDTRPSDSTVGLYAEPDLAAQWAQVLQIAKHQKTLILSYATGVHIYFPAVQNADLWTMYPGQLFPEDKQRLLDAIRKSDVVVEPMLSYSAVVDSDADVRSLLAPRCETGTLGRFRIWWLHPPEGLSCVTKGH